MKKPILCLDFDGVVHSYTSGWQGADVIPDDPVEDAIAFMLSALHNFDVVIFSSRSNHPSGLKAMQRWLKHHAGNCWYESPCGPGLEDVRFVSEKPPALVTLDDRALTFTGRWPKITDLLTFKPWNKVTPTKNRETVGWDAQECLTELMRGLEIPPSELTTSPQALYLIGKAIADQAKQAPDANRASSEIHKEQDSEPPH